MSNRTGKGYLLVNELTMFKIIDEVIKSFIALFYGISNTNLQINHLVEPSK